MSTHTPFEDKADPGASVASAEAANRPRLQAGSEIRILIVDDEEAVCAVLEYALAGNGYVIDSVSDPALMEARIRSKTYHLVILDYVIPGLSAEQVFDWVHEFQKDASIIVVTGYPSVSSALSCLRARIYDYLTKPFETAQLQEVVARCLEAKGLLRLSEDALREALGAVIREHRKAQGLTLKQVADKADVSLGYLSQIELGKNSASIETLYKLSLGLGVRLADLFQSIQIRQ
jgi:DNA-binding response OmpR family regulator